MIVCQCNIISDREIEAVIRELLSEDPWQLIVPGKVYRIFEKRGRCCGCFPNVVDIIIRVTEAFHLERDTGSAELIDLQVRLSVMKRKHEGVGRHERRRTGHRAA